MLGAACRCSPAGTHSVDAPRSRSVDAAADAWGCVLALAHDLNDTTLTVPVELVAPLTMRTNGTANTASGSE
jgi:hypothetical protein